MNDQRIRNILISYLQTVYSEVRIYQEKSIGAAACDVMAVADCLTGYEIKGNQDDFRRLGSQINAYNRFFDRNYIVVGAPHRQSTHMRTLDDWGVIIVEDADVTVEREAKSHEADHRAQLSILWMMKLKNLLVKHGMLIYPYKSKSYIIERLTERVNRKEISQHIVYEGMWRWDPANANVKSP